jgi:hypothetical protein
MPQLEPTYLRYIYDGLIKGSIHPENAAELPEGLIGLYEEAFDERTSAVERQKLLRRFAIWALLKKEVSAQFVAEVLEEREEDIIDFISTYSAWFNSPENGKYQLYHERLKVYLLQKLSEVEVSALHEKLIARLDRALEEQKEDEFEWYGLANLCIHLSFEAFSKNGQIYADKLFELSQSRKFWKRQKATFGNYRHSKNALQNALFYFQKDNADQALSIHKGLIDLFNLQRELAESILLNFHLYSSLGIVHALEDYHNASSEDEEGFFLYLIVLMENIKSKSGMSVLVKQEMFSAMVGFVENEMTHKLSEWNQLVAEDRVLDVCANLKDLGIETSFLFNQLKHITLPTTLKESWISILKEVRNPRIDAQIALELCCFGLEKNSILGNQEVKKIFFDFVQALEDSELKNEVFLKYLQRFYITPLFSITEFHMIQESILCIENSSSRNQKLVALIDIVLSGNDLSLVENMINQISTSYWKCLATQKYFIRKEYTNKEAVNLLLEISNGINNESVRNESMKEIVCNFGKFHFDDLHGITKTNITSHYWKSMSLLELGKVDSTKEYFNEAVQAAEKIPRDAVKSEAFAEIAAEFVRHGQFHEAILLIEHIPSYYWKCIVWFELIRNSDGQLRNNYLGYVKELASKIEKVEVRSEIYCTIVKISRDWTQPDEWIETLQLIETKKYQNDAFRFIGESFVIDSEWSSFAIRFLFNSTKQFPQHQKNELLTSLLRLPKFSSDWDSVFNLLRFSTNKSRILQCIEFLRNQPDETANYLPKVEDQIAQLLNNSDRGECQLASVDLHTSEEKSDSLLTLVASIESPYWRAMAYLRMYENGSCSFEKIQVAVELSIEALENQGFKDEVLYKYFCLTINEDSDYSRVLFERLHSKYWKTRCGIFEFEDNLRMGRAYVDSFDHSVKLANQIDNSTTRSEALLSIGLKCLKNNCTEELNVISKSALIPKDLDNLTAYSVSLHIDELSDLEIMKRIDAIVTNEVKIHLIATVSAVAFKSKRFDLLSACMDQINERKERLMVFDNLLDQIFEENRITVPEAFQDYISEIVSALSVRNDLGLLNKNFELYCLANVIHNETIHYQLFQKYLLKELLLDADRRLGSEKLDRMIKYNLHWAIDTKNQLPN